MQIYLSLVGVVLIIGGIQLPTTVFFVIIATILTAGNILVHVSCFLRPDYVSDYYQNFHSEGSRVICGHCTFEWNGTDWNRRGLFAYDTESQIFDPRVSIRLSTDCCVSDYSYQVQTSYVDENFYGGNWVEATDMDLDHETRRAAGIFQYTNWAYHSDVDTGSRLY